SLKVPIQVDLQYGRNWADAKHTWEELAGTTPTPSVNGFHFCNTEASDPGPPETTQADETPMQGKANPAADGNGYQRHKHRGHSSDGRIHGDEGPKRGKTIAQWFYQDPPDRPNYLRVDKHITAGGDRKFFQQHWNGAQWVLGVKGTYAERKVPYRLPELR